MLSSSVTLVKSNGASAACGQFWRHKSKETFHVSKLITEVFCEGDRKLTNIHPNSGLAWFVPAEDVKPARICFLNNKLDVTCLLKIIIDFLTINYRSWKNDTFWLSSPTSLPALSLFSSVLLQFSALISHSAFITNHLTWCTGCWDKDAKMCMDFNASPWYNRCWIYS